MLLAVFLGCEMNQLMGMSAVSIILFVIAFIGGIFGHEDMGT